MRGLTFAGDNDFRFSKLPPSMGGYPHQYAHGWLPFFVPSQIDGKDIELWDGETTFKKENEVYDPEYEYSATYLASNSSEEYLPVVGNGSGWVEVSPETACKIYWRAKGLTFANESLSADITCSVVSDETVTISVSTNKQNGIQRIPFLGKEPQLVAYRYPFWNTTPAHSYFREVYWDGTEYQTIDESGSGSAIISGGDSVGYQMRLDVSILEGYLPQSFRQVKSIPGRLFFNLSSIFQNIAVSCLETALGTTSMAGIVTGDTVGSVYCEQYSPSTGVSEIGASSISVDLLGETVSVRELLLGGHRYSGSFEDMESAARSYFPSSFSLPDLQITAEKFFTYGGIYDESTGAKV